MPKSIIYSIIVATYNSQSTINACLQSLIVQKYTAFEIIVVDDGSTDDTINIVKRYPNIHLITQSHAGPSAARNLGVKKSRGTRVVFIDSDCVVKSNFLIQIDKEYTNSMIAGVGGKQLSPENDSDFGKAITMFFFSISKFIGYVNKDNNISEVKHTPSCCSSYKKDVFKLIKGFDEKLYPGEDVDLDLKIGRLGYVLIFTPNAIVYHYRPDDITKFMRMMRMYGKSAAEIFGIHGFCRAQSYLPFITMLISIIFLCICVWKTALALWLLIVIVVSVVYLFWKSEHCFSVALRNFCLLLISLVFWNAGFIEGLLILLKRQFDNTLHRITNLLCQS